MALLQQYYNNTMDVLQVCRLWVTTGHYGHYGHYRFRGKAPWFADVRVTRCTLETRETPYLTRRNPYPYSGVRV